MGLSSLSFPNLLPLERRCIDLVPVLRYECLESREERPWTSSSEDELLDAEENESSESLEDEIEELELAPGDDRSYHNDDGCGALLHGVSASS